MKIKISISTPSKSYYVYADENDKQMMVNDMRKPLSHAFLTMAIDVVKAWPEMLEDAQSHDLVKYQIIYTDNDVTRTLVGNHATPENFNELMMLINSQIPKTNEQNRFERNLKCMLEHLND